MLVGYFVTARDDEIIRGERDLTKQTTDLDHHGNVKFELMDVTRCRVNLPMPNGADDLKA